MTPVTLYRKTFTRACIMTVEAGSSGLSGGDSGHGGRAVLRLYNGGGAADFRVQVDFQEIPDADKLEIIVGGDHEILNLVESLEFAAKVLRAQIGAPSGDANPKTEGVE